MELPFIKCHGSGNDFILVDEEATPLQEASRSRLVAGLCDRVHGIGADGVLFYTPAPGRADACMRIFNADGSEARMCGNGIRCLGRYAAEKLGRALVSIVVMDVVLSVGRAGEIFPGVAAYETGIGPISLVPASLPLVWPGERLVEEPLPPLSPSLRFTALSVPNPHLSAEVAGEIDKEELIRIGRLANGGHALFPEGVNVSFRRRVGDGALFVATFERGVGWTHSCGTAMTASVFAACLAGAFAFDRRVEVFNAGGKVLCTARWGGEGGVHAGVLAGNATFEWEGVARIDLDDPVNLLQSVRRTRSRDAEIHAYDRFKSACAGSR